jgi:hypothetical protein
MFFMVDSFHDGTVKKSVQVDMGPAQIAGRGALTFITA